MNERGGGGEGEVLPMHLQVHVCDSYVTVLESLANLCKNSSILIP